MSFWYDKKGKSYASKGTASWVKAYAEHLVASLQNTVSARLDSHIAGTEGPHRVESIIVDETTSLQDVLEAADTALENKVDKETGKGLSESNFTQTEKNKLSGIQDGATKGLSLTNAETYTPSADYHPATKKYVDDSISEAGGGDMLRNVYDLDQNGVVDDAEKLGGQLPAYYASQANLTSLESTVDQKIAALQGVVDNEILGLQAQYLTPPALTEVTPRGTKIGSEGWTGTGFFCTDTDTLYAVSSTAVPNNSAYTRFCLRPANLDDKAYLNWTPYFVSGDTEIEFFWSPIRGLYEGLVLTTDETAEDFLANYIVWKFHPPVQMRYGKVSNFINRYVTTATDGTESVSFSVRDTSYLRDFSGVLTEGDMQIISSYVFGNESFSDLCQNLVPTECSFLYLAMDTDGDGYIAARDWMGLSSAAQSSSSLAIETIDNFAS